MGKRALFVVLAAGLVMGAACPNTNSSDNALVPRPWSEAYGNKQNTGFNAVHTTYALPVLKKWTASVGPTYTTAPTLGPDGVAWVTNNSGELVGINPDGSQHRRRKLDDTIVAAPAINSDTNEIFVVGEKTVDSNNGDYTSHIYRLDAGASLLAVSSAPLRTGASPKLWKNYLFVPSNGLVMVFDQTSLELVGQAGTTACFNLVCGSTDIDIIGAFETITECILTFGLAGDCAGFHGPALRGPFLEPSVAIFDQANVVGNTSQPIIVTISPVCASGFRFHPAGDAPPIVPPVDRHFDLLWSHALVDIDCDFKSVRTTSPVALPGSAVVYGDENGRVQELDALTGEVLWERQLSEAVQCPPISAERQIYVVEYSHMATLDSNGVVLEESPLIGNGLASALSLDYVYVATTEGLHSFGISQNQGQTFAPTLTGTNSEAEAVAVAQDGTLYVTSRYKDSSTPESYLATYASHGSIAQLVAVPTLAWQAPFDGATLTSAPGQSLQASVTGVGGSAFQGTVTFSSNLDGVLCSGVVPSGSGAACATTKVLTIGTHQLTVFATDSDGGTKSATITIQVADTPPSVTITAPANGISVRQGSSITFQAQVTDPDQASFADDKVQWQSSRDGNLGSGLALTTSSLSAGAHTITATVTDNAGATGAVSIAIVILG